MNIMNVQACVIGVAEVNVQTTWPLDPLIMVSGLTGCGGEVAFGGTVRT
jgi:hypothetical protein